MPVETLSYQGINRAVSDYAGARACEELINIRPTTEGLVPVKQFSTKFSNKDFEKVFVHHTTSGPKYIAVRKGTGRVLVQLLDPSGNPVTPSLFEVECSDQQAVIDNLSFAAAGNIILFSICADPVFENHAFTWKDGSYQITEADVPDVDFDVEDGDTIKGIWQSIPHINKNSSAAECTEAVANGINAVQEENADLCLGPIVIAVAFKTKDGSTFWTGNWRVYDPITTVRMAQDSPYVDPTIRTSEVYADFFEKYGFGYECGGTHGNIQDHIYVYGTNVSLEFPRIASWNENTSLIESVEVYTSRPQVYLDANGAFDGLIELTGEEVEYLLVLPQKKYEDMDLGGQLLYHQASIPMASLKDGDQTVKLTFGGNVQATEDTLDADAGALKRYGKLLSYNARFHYFDSVAKMDIGMPRFTWGWQTSNYTVYVFGRYSDNEHTELLYLGTATALSDEAKTVITPSLNIKEVITYAFDGISSTVAKYRMQASSAYNYAICTEGAYDTQSSTGRISEYENKIGGDSIITTIEKAAINVTEQYNPFVFRVEHSYLAPGNVLDVKPQMAGIVDASYGRDPLNVFTERGLYALTQGSANVLYGAFLPLSDLVVSGPSVATEMGIFFLADGALWLIAGRRATLVSDALHLGPHKFLRASTGYKKISGTDTAYSPDPAPANPVYDISSSLSQVPFDQYVKSGATLSFNRFRMDLFVSNKAYTYTYVLSLKYRQWHKITTAVWQDEPGATIVTVPSTTAGRINVLDMSVETDLATDVHLQTRPFSMGYQYSHVHRLLSMVRAEFGGATEHLTVALYGSDNLQDWKLLAYSHRSGKSEWNEERESLDDTPLKVSQIRTATSSRSWRYYAICLGGHIHTGYDIDFGPFLVDYEPVIRRIG